MNIITVKRIDPRGCGCTNCIVGDSVPMDQAGTLDLFNMINGQIHNATGYPLDDFTINFHITLPDIEEFNVSFKSKLSDRIYSLALDKKLNKLAVGDHLHRELGIEINEDIAAGYAMGWMEALMHLQQDIDRNSPCH